MPGGLCGVWPAFWLVGPDWPQGGEIDIIEGANAMGENQMTLHTSAGCRIKGEPEGCMSGTVNGTDCESKQGDDFGCAVTAPPAQGTFGEEFNRRGGGVYATELDPETDRVSIWFFPRDAIPADVAAGKPDPDRWSVPMARFDGSGGGCGVATHFRDMSIIFDTTFCGDWAGNTWGQSSCASKAPTCAEFVAGNPGAFADACWAVNSVEIFEKGRGKVGRDRVGKEWRG